MGNCNVAGSDSFGRSGAVLTELIKGQIRDALAANNIFNDVVTQKKLTDLDMSRVVNRFAPQEFDEGEKVFEFGDAADRCYYLERGGVDVVGKDGIKFLSLVPGKIFGEIGFLNGATRSATIVANKKTTLFSLTLKDFELTTAEEFSDKDLADMPLIREAFANKSPEHVTAVVTLMKRCMFKFRRGEYVCTALTENKFFYIVIRGSVRLSSPTNSMKEIEELTHNDYFGEVAIINETEQVCEHCAQVSAQGETLVVKISEAEFDNGVFKPVKDLLTRRMVNTRKQLHKRELSRQLSILGPEHSGALSTEDALDFTILDTPRVVAEACVPTNFILPGGGGGTGVSNNTNGGSSSGNSSGNSGKTKRAVVTDEIADTKRDRQDCSPVDCLVVLTSPHQLITSAERGR